MIKSIFSKSSLNIIPKCVFYCRYIHSDQQLDPSFRLIEVLKRRYFYSISNYIYRGGISGFYDLGPFGLQVKKNVIKKWKKHFIKEDDLLEIETSLLTSDLVLKSSGHYDKFADCVCSDSVNNKSYRFDFLFKEHLQTIIKRDIDVDEKLFELAEETLSNYYDYSQEELIHRSETLKLKSPDGSDLRDHTTSNLLFRTQVGYRSKIKAALRPETAQGTFVNFSKLANFNNYKVPFGVAQIGKVFRNEIDPKNHLLRMREFTQAEIEYFTHPDDKTHSKIQQFEHIHINILPKNIDKSNYKDAFQVTINEALQTGIISNQVLAYYIARTYLFMQSIGIDTNKIRFRQHHNDELAHYAADCWDLEYESEFYGWVECASIADRTSFDLSRHAQESGSQMMIKSSPGRPYVPHVIEPSFGIDRIMHIIFEEGFSIDQKDPNRTFINFEFDIAPVHCSVLPVVANSKELIDVTSAIEKRLQDLDVRIHKCVNSLSIGKRYQSIDEIGVPFAISIDTRSLAHGLVSLRRNSTKMRKHVDLNAAHTIIYDLIHKKIRWDDIDDKFHECQQK